MQFLPFVSFNLFLTLFLLCLTSNLCYNFPVFKLLDTWSILEFSCFSIYWCMERKCLFWSDFLQRFSENLQRFSENLRRFCCRLRCFVFLLAYSFRIICDQLSCIMPHRLAGEKGQYVLGRNSLDFLWISKPETNVKCKDSILSSRAHTKILMFLLSQPSQISL